MFISKNYYDPTRFAFRRKPLFSLIFVIGLCITCQSAFADSCSKKAFEKEKKEIGTQCLLNPSKTFLVSYKCQPEFYTSEITGETYRKFHYRYTGHINCDGERHGTGVYEALKTGMSHDDYIGEFQNDEMTGWGKMISSYGNEPNNKTGQAEFVLGYFLDGHASGSVIIRSCSSRDGCGTSFSSVKLFQVPKSDLYKSGLEPLGDGPEYIVYDSGEEYKAVYFEGQECGFDENKCQMTMEELGYPAFEINLSDEEDLRLVNDQDIWEKENLDYAECMQFKGACNAIIKKNRKAREQSGQWPLMFKDGELVSSEEIDITEHEDPFMYAIDEIDRERVNNIDSATLEKTLKTQYLQQVAERKQKRDVIFENCIVAQMPSPANKTLEEAIKKKCRRIAENPSFIENMRYR